MRNKIEEFLNRSYELPINEAMLTYDYQFPDESIIEYVNHICTIPISEYVHYIEETYGHVVLHKSDFMQFSDPHDATDNLCAKFREQNGAGLEAYDIGFMLLENGKKHEAYRKYGEGNGKAGTILGLLSCFSNTYFLSCLGYILPELVIEERDRLLARCILRSTEYRQIFVELKANETINIREYMSCLTESTYVRRRSTFKNLLRMLVKGNDDFFDEYLKRIIIP